MKKLLLSLALLGGLSFGANAELYYTCEGQTYHNGDVINYEGYEYVPVLNPDGSPSGMYQFKVDPEVNLVSTESTESAVVSTTSNIAVNLCAGGDCTNGTNNVKTDVKLVANEPLNLQMDYAPAAINFGEDVEVPAITVKITSTVGNETCVVTVNMGGLTAGVESLGVNQDSVRVIGKSLNYDVTGSAQLSIYSLSGKTVVNKTVAGNGSVNLVNLSSGIYLYRLNGRTGKFIIK